MPEFSLDSVRPVFRAVATTVVPEAASLDPAAWSALEGIVVAAIQERPERVRRQLVMFLELLQRLPIAIYGRPFTRLSAARRLALLERLQNAPLLLLRRGVWGLRTLVFMGYYARPEAAEAIGYRARSRGWEARGGNASTVPFATSAVFVEPP